MSLSELRIILALRGAPTSEFCRNRRLDYRIDEFLKSASCELRAPRVAVRSEGLLCRHLDADAPFGQRDILRDDCCAWKLAVGIRLLVEGTKA